MLAAIKFCQIKCDTRGRTEKYSNHLSNLFPELSLRELLLQRLTVLTINLCLTDYSINHCWPPSTCTGTRVPAAGVWLPSTAAAFAGMWHKCPSKSSSYRKAMEKGFYFIFLNICLWKVNCAERLRLYISVTQQVHLCVLLGTCCEAPLLN